MNKLIRGISYHIESEGDGEPLLAIHGFTGSLSTWQFLQPSLTDRFRIIRIDVIGHGETGSPADPRRYSMAEAAFDLAALLDHLHLDRAHVLGYSMGGRLALSFACLHPERVKSLILESASPGLELEKLRQERRRHDTDLANFILKNGIRAFVDRWENIPLFTSQNKLTVDQKTALRKQRLANHESGLACSLIGMGTGAQPSWWNRLETLSQPVLLITGEQDRKFCTIADQMNRRLANSAWRVVKNTGHAVHLEDPSTFAGLVRTFLIKQSRSR
ncbi:2-succinyl-6-hydroxy-2,4-cyclohexadiene-1-carboxylate synthase [Sporolactobacillus sp. THM7-4]|nr:2-succinyl-6-hydroxy-2,4-cyclohexadiene-1-carboxylate synthase [Sporolactobacillus sp. THM7-4]